jgi:tetratricopeptide (TPR) repeat protein
VRSAPGNVLVWVLLGHAYTASAQPEKAESAFPKAIDANPRVAGGHVELVRFLASQQATDKAIAAAEAGLKALPGDRSLSLQLAELHRTAGRTEHALRIYQQTVATDPGNDLAANNLACLLLEHYADTASHMRALQLASRFEHSSQPLFTHTLGWAHYRLGNYGEAAAILTRAVQRAPDSPLLRFHLGMALQRSGEGAAARPHLEQALTGGLGAEQAGEARKALEAENLPVRTG